MDRQTQTPWAPPDFESFLAALKKTKGAGGLDGWEADELRGGSWGLPGTLLGYFLALVGGIWASIPIFLDSGSILNGFWAPIWEPRTPQN